jgi:hypothetical protein
LSGHLDVYNLRLFVPIKTLYLSYADGQLREGSTGGGNFERFRVSREADKEETETR